MIRIVLRGRTANNMFQYALGRTLAEKHGVPLVLDASWFNPEGWEQVSHFLRLPLKAKVVRRFSVGARALRKFTGKHYWEYSRTPFFQEQGDDHSFDPRFLDAPADCFLSGYFQSSLYFESISSSLRSEINGLISGSLRIQDDVFKKFSAPNTVAVHIRRTDYLEIPAFQVTDRNYYHDSMDEIRAQLPAARFQVFSDDPKWCHREFQSSDTEIIDSDVLAANPLYDLHLMSLANHHIIANSSYSWWAAWLGDKPDQRIIMPDRWFAHGIKAPMSEKRWK